MLRDGVDQLLDTFARSCGGADDRRLPRRVLREREHLREVAHGLIGARPIGLVHDEHVRDLEDAGFDRLDVVAEPWHGDETHGVGDAHDVHLLLAHADGLDDHDPVAKGVQDVHQPRGRACQAARMTAAGHRPDEDPIVERSLLHPDPVAENRAAGERARGVDGDDRDAHLSLAIQAREPIHERGLATTGRSGDTDDVGLPGLRVQRLQHRRR